MNELPKTPNTSSVQISAPLHDKHGSGIDFHAAYVALIEAYVQSRTRQFRSEEGQLAKGEPKS